MSAQQPYIGPPTIVGLQPVIIVSGYPFFTPPLPNPAQIDKKGVPLNGTVGAGPIPAFVPPTTFQLVDGSDP